MGNKLPKLQIRTETVKHESVEDDTREYNHDITSKENQEEIKTNPVYWVMFVIVFAISFIFMYELFSGKGIGSLLEGKSEKCKLEASNRAESLRDAKLEGLKLKENPTKEDLTTNKTCRQG